MGNSTPKSFQDWTEDDLLYILHVQRKRKHPILQEWLNLAKTLLLTDFEQYYLNYLQQKIELFIPQWQEAELRDNLIAPVLSIINFNDPEYFLSAFSERHIAAKVDSIELKGKVDWMLAIGKRTPKQPFFFIHEYKKEDGSNNDPLGQLLAAMFTAKILNQKPFNVHGFKPLIKEDPNMPVYGCYILGRYWHFVVLQGKEYCVSPSFDATDIDKLTQIVCILKAQKQMTISKLRKVSDAIES